MEQPEHLLGRGGYDGRREPDLEAGNQPGPVGRRLEPLRVHEERHRRQQLKTSQAVFARRVGSSQSRVAKMEAGDPSVSIDLLVRSLITAGSSAEEIGKVIASAGPDTAAA